MCLLSCIDINKINIGSVIYFFLLNNRLPANTAPPVTKRTDEMGSGTTIELAVIQLIFKKLGEAGVRGSGVKLKLIKKTKGFQK